MCGRFFLLPVEDYFFSREWDFVMATYEKHIVMRFESFAVIFVACYEICSLKGNTRMRFFSP